MDVDVVRGTIRKSLAVFYSCISLSFLFSGNKNVVALASNFLSLFLKIALASNLINVTYYANEISIAHVDIRLLAS